MDTIENTKATTTITEIKFVDSVGSEYIFHLTDACKMTSIIKAFEDVHNRSSVCIIQLDLLRLHVLSREISFTLFDIEALSSLLNGTLTKNIPIHVWCFMESYTELLDCLPSSPLKLEKIT